MATTREHIQVSRAAAAAAWSFHEQNKESPGERHFQVHWWKHQVGGLQLSGDISAVSTRCCQRTFLSFGLVDARGLFTHPKGCIYRMVPRLMGHIQSWTINGHLREFRIAQDNLPLGSGSAAFQLLHNHSSHLSISLGRRGFLLE